MFTTIKELSDALTPILANTDFEKIGNVKVHQKSKPNEPTGYLAAVLAMDGKDGIIMGGERFYSSRIQVNIIANRLTDVQRTETLTGPKAATANSSALRNLIHGNGAAIAVAAKPAAQV